MKLAIFDPFEITNWQNNSPVLIDGIADAIADLVADDYAIAFVCNQDCDELQCAASELDESIVGCYIPSLDPACKPVNVESFNKISFGDSYKVALGFGDKQCQLFAPDEIVHYKFKSLDVAVSQIRQCLDLVNALPITGKGINWAWMTHAIFSPDKDGKELISVSPKIIPKCKDWGDPDKYILESGYSITRYFGGYRECKNFRLPMTGMIHAWKIWACIRDDEAENILVVSNQPDLQSAGLLAGFTRILLDEAIAEKIKN